MSNVGFTPKAEVGQVTARGEKVPLAQFALDLDAALFSKALAEAFPFSEFYTREV